MPIFIKDLNILDFGKLQFLNRLQQLKKSLKFDLIQTGKMSKNQ